MPNVYIHVFDAIDRSEYVATFPMPARHARDYIRNLARLNRMFCSGTHIIDMWITNPRKGQRHEH